MLNEMPEIERENEHRHFNRVFRAFETKRQLIYPKFELNEPNEMSTNE